MRYINKYGLVSTYVAQIKHDLQDPVVIKAAYDDIVSVYNNNIILIRGYIEDVVGLKKTASIIKTDKLHIVLNKKSFKYYELKEPAFGSVEECIKRNLHIDFQNLVAKYTPFSMSIAINLINVNTADDVYYLPLTEVTDNGLNTRVYELNFKFAQDWSSTCDSCTNGLAHIKNELGRISDHLYVSNDAGIKTNTAVISDLSVQDSNLLKAQIGILLANAIKTSKIADFTITDVTTNFKGIDYG